MNVYDNSLYLEDVNYVANLNLPWEKLNNKSIMISGATGLIGSMLVDIIMRKNDDNLNCTVYALGRSEERSVIDSNTVLKIHYFTLLNMM